MALSTAIYNIIRADATCLSAFGDRIEPILIDLGQPMPALSYQIDSITPEETQTEPNEWDVVMITMTVMAETFSLCETYSNNIRTAVTRYVGTTGGVTVLGSNFLGMSFNEILDRGTGEASETGKGIYSSNIQFQIITSA